MVLRVKYMKSNELSMKIATLCCTKDNRFIDRCQSTYLFACRITFGPKLNGGGGGGGGGGQVCYLKSNWIVNQI